MHGSPPKTRRCDSSTTRSPTVAARSSSAKLSGTSTTLPAREKLLAFARKGDVVVVWKLDRLGRSLRDLIDVVNSLQDRGVGLRSLQEAIDTTTPAGKLTFHIFAALAEFERDMIRERTRAGLAAAHKRGVAIGRPRALTPEQILMAAAMTADPAISTRQVAEQFGSVMGRSTQRFKESTGYLRIRLSSFKNDYHGYNS